MAKRSIPVETKTTVAPAANQNFRGRIVFKSGGTQDLLVVAISTNAFTQMQSAYQLYLSGAAGASKYYVTGALGWTITIYWPDVSALYTSVD